jgi:hypothetical protein
LTTLRIIGEIEAEELRAKHGAIRIEMAGTSPAMTIRNISRSSPAVPGP